jgi:PII-like signaling protein
VRIPTHERVRVGCKLVADVILEIVRRDTLGGVTVTRAIEDWSAHVGVHTSSWVELSDDLPVVTEMVDRAEKIEAALAYIVSMSGDCGSSVTDVRLYVAD